MELVQPQDNDIDLVPSLQQVTDVGATTTNNITVNSLIETVPTLLKLDQTAPQTTIGTFIFPDILTESIGVGNNGTSYNTLIDSSGNLIFNNNAGFEQGRLYTDGFNMKFDVSNAIYLGTSTFFSNNSSGYLANGGISWDSAGNLTAPSLIKAGGASTQFLKADGSVDSSDYITSGALSNLVPYTGAGSTVDLNSQILKSGEGIFGDATNYLRVYNNTTFFGGVPVPVIEGISLDIGNIFGFSGGLYLFGDKTYALAPGAPSIVLFDVSIGAGAFLTYTYNESFAFNAGNNEPFTFSSNMLVGGFAASGGTGYNPSAIFQTSLGTITKAPIKFTQATNNYQGSYLSAFNTYPQIGALEMVDPDLTIGLTDSTQLFTSFLRTNWTLTTGWDSTNVSDTKLYHNANGTGTATLNGFSATVGTTYKIIVTVDSFTSSLGTYLDITLGGTSYSVDQYGSQTGTPRLDGVKTYTAYVTATTTGGFIVTPSSTSARVRVSAISIQPVSRKQVVTTDGTKLTSGKIPVASTNGRLIDGETPLAGTKVYYVSDTLGGLNTRKLTFQNGILTAEI